MNNLMSVIMLNCEQASLLAIKKEEVKLSLVDKMRLWMHTNACKFCREFSYQNKFINKNTEFHFHDASQHLKPIPKDS